MRYDDWLEAPFQEAEDVNELYEWAQENGIDTNNMHSWQIEELRKECGFVEPDIND